MIHHKTSNFLIQQCYIAQPESDGTAGDTSVSFVRWQQGEQALAGAGHVIHFGILWAPVSCQLVTFPVRILSIAPLLMRTWHGNIAFLTVLQIKAVWQSIQRHICLTRAHDCGGRESRHLPLQAASPQLEGGLPGKKKKKKNANQDRRTDRPELRQQLILTLICTDTARKKKKKKLNIQQREQRPVRPTCALPTSFFSRCVLYWVCHPSPRRTNFPECRAAKKQDMRKCQILSPDSLT